MANNFERIKKTRGAHGSSPDANLEQLRRKDMSEIKMEDLIDLRALEGADFSIKESSADITYVKKSSKGLIGSIIFGLLLVAIIVAGTWVFTGKIINTGVGTVDSSIEGIKVGNFMITHDEKTNYSKDVSNGETYLIDGGFYSDSTCTVRMTRDSMIYCESSPNPVTSLSWKIDKE